MNRKLYFFVTEDWYFCSHRLPLAVAAKSAGYDVAVITRVREHGDEIRDAGIRVIPFENNRKSLNIFSQLAIIVRLIRIYKEEKPDIVHHVAIKPVVYGAIAARIAGISHVVHALAGLGWLASSRSRTAVFLGKVARVLFKVILSRGHVIVQNPDDQAWLHMVGVCPARVLLIRGSGVDINTFYPRTKGRDVPVVVLVARMLWDKGVGQFVEAAREVHKIGEKVRFVLVGSPDNANPASIPENQLKAWVCEGDIEWWGRRSDMVNVLAQADIACLPSYYGEGVPKSLLEAAASGLPIITTDSPGCREVVVHGHNGLLVPPREVSGLTSALIQLIRAPAERRRMGENSREMSEKEFSIDKVVAETLALYSEILR